MPTPHNTAKKGDFAHSVLMPGDPQRAKYIAENFLEDAVLVNNIRGINGYTGTWKGVKVSVMASGMGMPSIGIYSHELFNEYDVENIIRVGSAGGCADGLKLMDVVAGIGACTDSNYIDSAFRLPGTFAPTADFKLLCTAVECAKERGVDMKVGNLLSSDVFYHLPNYEGYKRWRDMGVLAVEMESAALYSNAAKAGKRALTICTISDLLFGEGEIAAEDRATSLKNMIEIALDTAAKMG